MMRSRWKSVVRMALLLLLVGGVSTNCAWLQRMRQTPRQHWWEFWKPKRPANDLIYPGDIDVTQPPPPPRIDATGPGIDATGIPLDVPPTPPTIAAVGDVPPEPQPVRRPPQGMVTELQTVYFEYDQFRLTAEAVRILDGNAQFLVGHPELRVLIEGHCDERGTLEYNFQLGQRRADAVREYLISKGITADQLNTISFGEERPAVSGSDEQAWSRNRRAQFQIY